MRQEIRRARFASRLALHTDLDFHRIADLVVGHRSFTTLSDAFDRRLGCRPRVYRETAGRGRRYEVPRFLAAFQATAAGARCARCGSERDAVPAVPIFERLEPLCKPCARRHAPRELLAHPARRPHLYPHLYLLDTCAVRLPAVYFNHHTPDLGARGRAAGTSRRNDQGERR